MQQLNVAPNVIRWSDRVANRRVSPPRILSRIQVQPMSNIESSTEMWRRVAPIVDRNRGEGTEYCVRCHACHLCVDACPEHALRLVPIVEQSR